MFPELWLCPDISFISHLFPSAWLLLSFCCHFRTWSKGTSLTTADNSIIIEKKIWHRHYVFSAKQEQELPHKGLRLHKSQFIHSFLNYVYCTRPEFSPVVQVSNAIRKCLVPPHNRLASFTLVGSSFLTGWCCCTQSSQLIKTVDDNTPPLSLHSTFHYCECLSAGRNLPC